MPKLREPTKKEEQPGVLVEPKVGEIPQPEIVVKSDKDEAAEALAQQIVDLKKAEEIQRRRADQITQERDAAVKRANDREVQVAQFQREASDSKVEAIEAAIAAATAEATTAKQSMNAASVSGDPEALSEAVERLSTARANLVNLENGKISLEESVKREKAQAEADRQRKANDPLEGYNLPDTAKTWLRAHPDYLSDRRKNTRLQNLHYVVTEDEGHVAFSPEYYESIEIHEGMRKKPEPVEDDEGQGGDERISIVSAPVSRDTPDSQGKRQSGRVTLTKEQVEAAKIAGITVEEYIKQAAKMKEYKAQGMYSPGGN